MDGPTTIYLLLFLVAVAILVAAARHANSAVTQRACPGCGSKVAVTARRCSGCSYRFS